MSTEVTQNDIYNNNKSNVTSEDNYSKFNNFIFSDDLKLTGKFLHRFDYFSKTKHLPGDIVEIGVFKGSGMSSFLKFIQVYAPNSNKKVIGFDIFDTVDAATILNNDSTIDKKAMTAIYDRVDKNELTLEFVADRLKKTKVSEDKFILVRGDVEVTVKKFADENPGFRVALLYIDVDIARPTYVALKYLWDRVLPGGYIIFDEYEYHKFSESTGVDEFMKERGLKCKIRTTNWMAPTAYIRKPR